MAKETIKSLQAMMNQFHQEAVDEIFSRKESSKYDQFVKAKQELSNHLHDEHGLILLENEIQHIIHLAVKANNLLEASYREDETLHQKAETVADEITNLEDQ